GYDAIGPERVAVPEDRLAPAISADALRVHVGADLDAELGRADAVLGQELPLSLGCRPAVAAHRGHHERTESHVTERADGRFDDGEDMGDTATADANRHPGAGLEPAWQARLAPLTANLCGDVGHRRLGLGLPDWGDRREVHE